MRGKLAGKTVAVTGAGGFVGQYLLAALTDMDCTIKPLSRSTTDYSTKSLTVALAGVDSVIHLAGRRMTREDVADDLDPFIEPNVLLTGRLMDAARVCGVRRFVFASTIAVYNPGGVTPYGDDTSSAPINAYALSKKMAEDYLTLKSGPEVVSLRLAALYGHGEKGTPALMRFINQAAEGQKLTLNGNLNYGIDQLYVRDAVAALIAGLDPAAVAGAYNIGAGQVFTVQTLAQTVNKVFSNIDNLDISAATDGPHNATYMTIDHADTGLHWRPAYTLQAGLEDVRHMRQTQDI